MAAAPRRNMLGAGVVLVVVLVVLCWLWRSEARKEEEKKKRAIVAQWAFWPFQGAGAAAAQAIADGEA